jgi:hypothetical protein
VEAEGDRVVAPVSTCCDSRNFGLTGSPQANLVYGQLSYRVYLVPLTRNVGVLVGSSYLGFSASSSFDPVFGPILFVIFA